MIKRKSSVKNRIKKTPVTSPTMLENSRAKQAKDNKSRANRMEVRVAAYLGGERTPSSGSGSSKGDILVPFVHQPGRYMVECKLTAQKNGNDPQIRLHYSWLTKMESDAKALRGSLHTRFAILVFRFHNTSDDYVWIREEDVHIADSVSGTKDFSIMKKAITFDLRDKPRLSYNFKKSELEKHMLQSKSIDDILYPCVKYSTDVGTYICMHLTTFKLLLRNEVV